MLKQAGRPVRLVRTDDSEEDFFAVIEQTWKKNHLRFEDKASLIGRYQKEYYYYVGPADVDVSALTEEDTLYVGAAAFQFEKTEEVAAGGTVQFYRGILKKIKEADGNVFGR